MTIEFKPKSWTWTETTVKTQTCMSGEPSADVHTMTTEKVIVRFDIVGAPDMVRRSGRAVRFKCVVLEFTSTDGGPWKPGYRDNAVGNNVLKTGELGARVDLDYGWPAWLSDWRRSVVPMAWVLKMYPR